MTIPAAVEFFTLNDTLVGVNGNTLVSPDGLSHFVPGKIGKAWGVGNLANRVLVQNPGPFNPGATSWTVSWWVYVADTFAIDASYHWVLYDNTTLRGGVLSLTPSTFTVRLGTSSYAFQFPEDPETGDVLYPVVAGWNHLCVRFTAGETNALRGWINGGQDTGIYAETSGVVPNLASPIFRLGGTTSTPYDGPIDSWGWWASALTDEDVAELYNSGAGWEYAPPDNTPDAFDFTDVTDADPSTLYVSDSQEITGMDADTSVSITGGEYRINGGAWTSGVGTIDPGQTLELRGTSSEESEGVVTVTVTVGTLAVNWTITTGELSSVVSNMIGSSICECRIIRSRIVQGWV